MRSFLMLSTALALSACGGGPAPLQLRAERPVHLASGLPGIRVADAALAGGIPETALAITRGLLEANPNDLAALVKQGEALMAMGRPDAAAECYRRAITIDARAPEALLALGRVQLAAGQTAEAEALFRRVAASAPGNATAQNDLGIALDLQDRHADAQAAYRAALHAKPEMEAAQVNLRLSLAMATPSVPAPAFEPPARSRPGGAIGTAFGALDPDAAPGIGERATRLSGAPGVLASR